MTVEEILAATEEAIKKADFDREKFRAVAKIIPEGTAVGVWVSTRFNFPREDEFCQNFHMLSPGDLWELNYTSQQIEPLIEVMVDVLEDHVNNHSADVEDE